MSTLFMVDSIESPETTGQPIPQAVLEAPAVAGYLHGNSWPTYAPYARARPDLVQSGRLLSISLTSAAPARCLDIEAGGATNAGAPAWFRTHADRSLGKPVLYTSASNVDALNDTMSAAGIGRDEYLIWSAHYNYQPHVCAPAVCGYPAADGTQYTNRVPGNCDGSVMFDYCFPAAPVTPPPPPYVGEDAMIAVAANADGRLEAFVEAQPPGPGKAGQIWHCWQDKPGGSWHGAQAGKRVCVWEKLGQPGA